MTIEFEQDIAISFAGEDQEIATVIEAKLLARGLKVFFAPSKQAELLGERLEDVLAKKYGPTSRFVIVLVSDKYPIKDWARYELSVAHDEEKERKKAFILPLLLADVRMMQIPSDKVYLDLRKMDLNEIIDILVEKVRLHRGEIVPNDVFDVAFREWKVDGFIPGSTKGDVFWADVSMLVLDENRVEFLLKCPCSLAAQRQDGLANIASKLLATAAKRLVDNAENQNFRLSAICYLGVANPVAAEQELWAVYENKSLHLNDRARALALFWKCPGERSHQKPREILIDKKAPWQLRRAAAMNVLCSEFEDDTEQLLDQALLDPRQEVRSKVVDGILRFKLANLSSSLMDAYQKERSRKGKAEIKHALRHFNDRSDVVKFGTENAFGNAFFRPPTYIHNWVDERNDAWF